MSTPSLADLVRELSQGPLLNAERRQELTGLQAACADARALARELLQRNWLTPYQVNQLLQGRGRDLVLGPYVLQERLGEGGMGQVFKAHHTFLNRPVAIKLIGQAQLSSGSAAERFLVEMQLAAHLDHPHIVRALDAGQVGDRYYLAMELIQGMTLTRLVEKKGPLPVGWACACISQAARGLHHASESGLVHRDIKPSNLMLSTPRAGGAPVVKVLDRGLARLQRNEGGRDLTRTGTVMGTLDYLAPEQALDPRGVDVRADIYSLGCTFFFLLTGRPPFQGGTEAQRLLQHQQQEPPAVESLRCDVPPAVAAVVRRMLAKRPEQRFATAGEVAEVLEPFASWAGWENGAPTTALAPRAPVTGGSLIDPPPLSGERGWTLLPDPTRAGVMPPTAVLTAGSAPTTAATSGFSIVLPDATQSAAPAAPSLVTEPAAAPEKGWTLLAEPELRPAAVPVAMLTAQPADTPVLAAPAPRPGLKGLRRSPWMLAAVGAAALLLLVGVVLLVRSWAGSSSAEIVAGQAPGKDGQPPPPNGAQQPPPVEKKGVVNKAPAPKKEWPAQAMRPVQIKPGQPQSMPRTGDLVYSAYPGGYLGMTVRNDNDTLLVYDLTTMQVARRFSALSGMDGTRVLSTDGRWLAGRVGNRVRVCYVDDAGKQDTATLTPSDRPDSLHFARPDRLVTLRHGGQTPGVEVWDLKTHKLAFALPLPGRSAADQAAVSPDGRLLVLPQGDLLLVQELREGAAPTIRAMPQPRRPPFSPRCVGLAFSGDGSALVGLLNEPHSGWRVVRWDVKNGTLQAIPAVDYPFDKDLVKHEHFYGGARLECLPGQGAWLVYGQALIDARTGKVLRTYERAGPFNQPVVRALTADYLFECNEREVRLLPVAQAK